MRRTARALGGLALVAGTALACGESGPPPYGLGSAPVQRYRLETEETLDVDGAPVDVRRLAELRLEVERADPGETRVQLFIDSYYMRVAGAPGGTSELSISERGVATSSDQGQRLLDPNAAGGLARELLRRPVEAVTLDPAGGLLEEIWHTPHAVLLSVHLLDWLLLGLGPLSPDGRPAWTGSRPVPKIGQYELGIELPIRGQRDPGDASRIELSGATSRDALRIAENFEGSLELDYRAVLELDALGRPVRARLELLMQFNSTTGSRVSSRHRVRIRCLDCGAGFSAATSGSDRLRGRERVQKQGHLDHLPHHGGVRGGVRDTRTRLARRVDLRRRARRAL